MCTPFYRARLYGFFYRGKSGDKFDEGDMPLSDYVVASEFLRVFSFVILVRSFVT